MWKNLVAVCQLWLGHLGGYRKLSHAGKYSEETGIYPYLLQFLVWLCMMFYMHVIKKDMDPAFKRAFFDMSARSGQYELPIDINYTR